MSAFTKIRNAIYGVVKPVIAVMAAVSPQVKVVAAALGITATTYAAVPESGTMEEKVVALAIAGVSYLVHKAFYMAKDYLDNGKLDKSVSA